MPTYTLGISAFYHDSAAALLLGQEIVACAQEERFTRKKHDASFPKNAIEYCLSQANIDLPQVDFVVYYEKPFIKFERLLETYLAMAPRGFRSFKMALPLWIREKLFQKDLLKKELQAIDPQFQIEKLLFSEHHLSHAASAFYPSPFEEAVVLTLDGVGEWSTTSVAVGKGKQLNIIKELHFPHSLGLLYSAFTYYTGFKVNSGEYKLMGLAPYGEPYYTDLILEHLLDLKDDGSFHLNQTYFNYCTGLTMTNRKFERLFGHPVRQPQEELTQFHMDVAASIQKVTELALLKITRHLAQETQITNLCLAGGVALNCVANGKILKDGQFKNLWIQPAAGDAGGALGAAYVGWHLHQQQPRSIVESKDDRMRGSYLGPQFSQDEIEQRLDQLGAYYETLDQPQMIQATVQALTQGKAVGWFQGRMEFGPRALGGRSILGDPRNPTMQKNLNLKVKYRESFRPFAPSVLREQVSAWFDLDVDSPYMLLVAEVHQQQQRAMTDEESGRFGIDKLNVVRSSIPAVTHVDYSARVQTVHPHTNPLYHQLISAFYEQTGCPVLVNTSFNVRGEPIVCTPEDAFRCFMGCEIEFLAIGNCVLYKEKQNPDLKLDYKHKFDLD